MNTDNDWPRMNTDKHGMTDARLLRDQRMQPPFEVAQRFRRARGRNQAVRALDSAGGNKWQQDREREKHTGPVFICVHLCASVASLSPCESVAGPDLWR